VGIIKYIKSLFLICVIFSGAGMLFSAENNPIQVEIILDASGSMYGKINKNYKISIAKNSLSDIARKYSKRGDILLGIRVFGHMNRKCTNSVLEIPIADINIEKILKKIQPLKPKGKTPIAYSLIKSADDFIRSTGGKKIVILITDGIQTCKGNPCAVAEKLEKEGVVTRIHLVGLGMSKDDLKPLRCITKPSGGMVVSVNNKKQMNSALINILDSALDNSAGKKSIDDEHKSAAGKGLKENSEKGSVDSKEIKTVKVEVECVDTKGRVIVTSVVVYESASKKVLFEKGRTERKVLSLVPGIYDIMITDVKTKAQNWIRNFETGRKKIIKHRVIIRRGLLLLTGISSSDNSINTSLEIYLSSSGGLVKKYGGAKMHSVWLAPGTYDIRIKDWYGSMVKWIRKISIKDGDEIKRRIIIDR